MQKNQKGSMHWFLKKPEKPHFESLLAKKLQKSFAKLQILSFYATVTLCKKLQNSLH